MLTFWFGVMRYLYACYCSWHITAWDETSEPNLRLRGLITCGRGCVKPDMGYTFWFLPRCIRQYHISNTALCYQTKLGNCQIHLRKAVSGQIPCCERWLRWIINIISKSEVQGCFSLLRLSNKWLTSCTNIMSVHVCVSLWNECVYNWQLPVNGSISESSCIVQSHFLHVCSAVAYRCLPDWICVQNIAFIRGNIT